MTSLDVLRDRARQLRVEVSCWDVGGPHHEASAPPWRRSSPCCHRVAGGRDPVAAAGAAAGSCAAVLRLDHVMGLHRLWWVPEGMAATEGASVRYPREELLAVVATEATGTSTIVIGEDVGTVPEVLSQALERGDVVRLQEAADDLLGETAPHDLPGQVVEATWRRRRLPHPASTVLADVDVRRRTDVLADRRTGGAA